MILSDLELAGIDPETVDTPVLHKERNASESEISYLKVLIDELTNSVGDCAFRGMPISVYEHIQKCVEKAVCLARNALPVAARFARLFAFRCFASLF